MDTVVVVCSDGAQSVGITFSDIIKNIISDPSFVKDSCVGVMLVLCLILIAWIDYKSMQKKPPVTNSRIKKVESYVATVDEHVAKKLRSVFYKAEGKRFFAMDGSDAEMSVYRATCSERRGLCAQRILSRPGKRALPQKHSH